MKRTEKDLQDALKSLTGCLLDKQPGYGEENEIIISPEDKNKLPIGTKEGILKSIDPNKEDGYTHEIYFPESNTSIWAKLTNDMGVNWTPSGKIDQDGKFYPDVEVIVTISLIKDTLQWKVVGVQEDAKITPGATTIDRGGSKLTVHENQITQEAGIPSNESSDSPDTLTDGSGSPVKFTISPGDINAQVYDNYYYLDPFRFEVAIPRYKSYFTVGQDITADHNGSVLKLKDPYANISKGSSNTWWNPNNITSTVGNTNVIFSPCLIQSQTGPANEILTCEYIQHEILDELIMMDKRTEKTSTPDQIRIQKNASNAQFDNNLIKIWKEDMPYGEAYIMIDKTESEEGSYGDRPDNILLEYGGLVRINPDEIWMNQVNNFVINPYKIQSTVFQYEGNPYPGDVQHKLTNGTLTSTIYTYDEELDREDMPEDDEREKDIEFRLERNEDASKATITVTGEADEEEAEYEEGTTEFKVDGEWAYINGQRICVEPCGEGSGGCGCNIGVTLFTIED